MTALMLHNMKVHSVATWEYSSLDRGARKQRVDSKSLARRPLLQAMPNVGLWSDLAFDRKFHSGRNDWSDNEL